MAFHLTNQLIDLWIKSEIKREKIQRKIEIF